MTCQDKIVAVNSEMNYFKNIIIVLKTSTAGMFVKYKSQNS
jgi:hypothetical protein